MEVERFQSEARQMERLLYRIAWSYMGNDQDAEDAVQDTLIKAWENRHTLREITRFKPWIARMLLDRCQEMLRRRKRWRFFPLKTALAEVDVLEEKTPIEEAMEQLKPELRVLMVLHDVDGYSVQEITEILGVPCDTIRTRMQKARRQISKTILVAWEDAV